MRKCKVDPIQKITATAAITSADNAVKHLPTLRTLRTVPRTVHLPTLPTLRTVHLPTLRTVPLPRL